MKQVISNSVVTIGSTVHGAISNTVMTQVDHNEVISDIERLIASHDGLFSKREIMALKEARGHLKEDNLSKAKQVLYYFKQCIEDIVKLSLSGALVDLIMRL